MDSFFVPVRYIDLPRNTSLQYPESNHAGKVSWTDNALLVMTDFARTTPFKVGLGTALDVAHEHMRTCGVRLLFVTDGDRNVLGLVTAADILGEKPVQYLQKSGGHRDQVMAEHIMTPIDQLQAVEYADVLTARVGNIVETIRAFGRQHLLVVQFDGSESRVRGIFSATQISRQLGAEVLPAAEPLGRFRYRAAMA